jgi:hypothetical protein
MTLARGVTLVGAVALMGFAPARIDNRLFIFGGMAAVIYANSLMLGYSPAMDRRLVVAATLLQGTGLGICFRRSARWRSARSIRNSAPKARPVEPVARLWKHDRHRRGPDLLLHNTQAMHLALAKNLTPYRAAAHVAGSIAKPSLAALNGMITQQAAVVACHRPVQDPDAGHADREPARVFSPQAAAGQLTFLEL